ncbi:MAG TPA: glycosyltransferase family 2 protein [Flavisolibacter sp.]|nr:glycosyltransferase family 2 protein [Flavisolibacter sp.]
MIFYNYFGYALIIFFLNRLGFKKRADFIDTEDIPGVSFIVAAYNEEDCIEKKIFNSLAQDYPSDKIEYIFITDGSTDQTPAIIKQYPAVQLFHRAERMGKTAAINRAVDQAKNEILIFSDANTLLNKHATKNIVKHYSDPGTGGVAGEKRVIETTNSDEAAGSEGLYWRYESFLKKIDSDFYSVVGAAGELFSLRKSLYEPVPSKVILDDFVISLKVAQKGYRFVYEPGAYAMELPSFSIQDEQKRKIRIAAGGFQAIGMLWKLLLFWKNPRLSFLYISHRVLRWTTSPICLVAALISNFLIIINSFSFFYTISFALQLAFYLASLTAYWSSKESKWHKMFKVAYYFVFMHISVIQGFFRFLHGKQSAAWEKAKRNSSILLERHVSE